MASLTEPWIDSGRRENIVCRGIKDTCRFYWHGLFSRRSHRQNQQFQKLPSVVKEEREFIDKAHEARADYGVEGLSEGQRFSVAFSGGGIRAAAFQAGVLWRLAEMNKLQDVEYLSAVSGGSYISTAFATHCMGEQPERGEDVNEWYKRVVAKTLLRMQENAGNFIRDSVKEPGFSNPRGEVCCPRSCDTFVLIGMLVYTLSVNPVVIMLCVALPLVNITNVFYGDALRAAFCANSEDWFNIFFEMARMKDLLIFILTLVLLTLIFKIMGAFVKKPEPWTDRLKPKPNVTCAYKFQRSLYFIASRSTCLLVFFVVFLYAIPWYERTLYHHGKRAQATKREMCCRYMDKATTSGVCSDDIHGSDHLSWDSQAVTCQNLQEPWTPSQEHEKGAIDFLKWPRQIVTEGYVWGGTLVFIFVLLLAAALLVPFFGAGIAMNVLFVAGPVFAFVWIVTLATIPVYGPITHGKGNQTVNYEQFQSVSKVGMCLAMIAAPLYEGLRNWFHAFYAHVLTSNYFKDGKNPSLCELAHKDSTKKIAAPFAPFIVFTGTSSDFQAAGDDDYISEVSFSPLHIGSEETDYIPTQRWFKMGTGTALSGAGCIDGIGLAMSDLISLRFWLEILNLSWGDFIVFDGNKCAEECSEWIGAAWQDQLIRMYYRFPSMLILFLVYLFFLRGLCATDCENAKMQYQIGLWMFGVVAFSSFFDVNIFRRINRFLTMSPFIRQMHQLLKFTFAGEHPPALLYVTDGGVQDCTTVGLLMKRRVERILLVSCGQDPQCKMGNFKDAMQQAQNHHLGCFYIPEDPRKEVFVRLEEFQDDKAASHLHIGIRYPEIPARGAQPGVPASFGHLLIVKNKLPTGPLGSHLEGLPIDLNGELLERPVLPPITEEEVVNGQRPERSAEFDEYWKDLKTNELGPAGCCDCCHVNSMNCLTKWPQGFAGNYLWLSPMFCSSLMRLGHELSEEPIKLLSESPTLACPWESSVGMPIRETRSARCSVLCSRRNHFH